MGVFRLSSASPPLEGPPSSHTRREYRKLAWGGTPPPTAVSIKRDDSVSAEAHPPLIQFHSTTGGSRNPSNLRTGSKPLLLETKGRDAQVGAGGGRTLSTRKRTPCHCFSFQGTRGPFSPGPLRAQPPVFREQKNLSPHPNQVPLGVQR